MQAHAVRSMSAFSRTVHHDYSTGENATQFYREANMAETASLIALRAARKSIF